MASSVSIEYLQAIQGVANGIATLGENGTIPASQLPNDLSNNFKGSYEDESEIIAAYPTANVGDYAYNKLTKSFWYWSEALNAWVNQNITVSNYNALSDEAKADVPYIIIAG